MQNFLHLLWNKLLEPRSLRFLFVGILGAIANILLVTALVNVLRWDTVILRSLANIVATEICLVISFFVYRQFVWQVERYDWQIIMQNELPAYHVSIASVIAVRSLFLFPLMDWIGIDPALNITIGIGLGAILTYTLNEKVIFTARIPTQ